MLVCFRKKPHRRLLKVWQFFLLQTQHFSPGVFTTVLDFFCIEFTPEKNFRTHSETSLPRFQYITAVEMLLPDSPGAGFPGKPFPDNGFL
jgi:hypothetical protein